MSTSVAVLVVLVQVPLCVPVHVKTPLCCLCSTLRYANRAKNIKNKPRINEDPKDALLRQYQEEIQQLKMMLLGQIEIPAGFKGENSMDYTYKTILLQL